MLYDCLRFNAARTLFAIGRLCHQLDSEGVTRCPVWHASTHPCTTFPRSLYTRYGESTERVQVLQGIGVFIPFYLALSLPNPNSIRLNKLVLAWALPCAEMRVLSCQDET